MITKKSITSEEYREWYEKENISKKGNERKPIRHLEGDLQKSCVKWFKLQYPHILFRRND